jgi:hypothetical protein
MCLFCMFLFTSCQTEKKRSQNVSLLSVSVYFLSNRQEEISKCVSSVGFCLLPVKQRRRDLKSVSSVSSCLLPVKFRGPNLKDIKEIFSTRASKYVSSSPTAVRAMCRYWEGGDT